jgi:hypothetical protein
VNPRKEYWDEPNQHSFADLFLSIWAGLTGIRADGFYWMFDQLEQQRKTWYRIVETGCMRSKYRECDFERDGCSTLIFDRFAQKMGGAVESVDSSVAAVEYARKFIDPNTTTVYCHDSILFLRNGRGGGKIDLLYLDSMDYDKAHPQTSELHHLFELTAAMRNLGRGSIVMVDDNYSDGTGKGRLVRKFFTEYGLVPAFEGRQLGWIIP